MNTWVDMKFDLGTRYNHKIKTPEEIVDLIGVFPRSKKVVMCHGVFDIVHPGHIRHFLAARNKAEILIVSLTSDVHINKGKYRPHIPEQLRAINLAALEFVDYVVIDSNPTPIANIAKIKPDLFAKGYEYSPDNKVIQKTRDEIQTVKSYGGEVIFTPGDFILSSSKFINASPPDLRYEKLLLLMQRSNIQISDLENALDMFKNLTVHVVGDTIIDTYTECSMIGGQTKTPTISVKFESKVDILGGAGIVARHLNAAGASVIFSTILGQDDYAEFVESELQRDGIKNLSIVDRNRPTTNKNAIVVGGYRLLKVDTLDNGSISDDQLNLLRSQIMNEKCDAVVFSDFRHGIFNKRTIAPLMESIPSNTFKVADSQVASRWGNILDFQRFDLITPNEREARFALGDQDSGIRSLVSELYEKSQCKLLILKLGDKGIITCQDSEPSTLDSYFVMDSFVEKLVDPVGAGDALLAYSTLAMLSTKNSTIASILGNLAAACECELEGNVPVTPDDLRLKISYIAQALR